MSTKITPIDSPQEVWKLFNVGLKVSTAPWFERASSFTQPTTTSNLRAHLQVDQNVASGGKDSDATT